MQFQRGDGLHAGDVLQASGEGRAVERLVSERGEDGFLVEEGSEAVDDDAALRLVQGFLGEGAVEPPREVLLALVAVADGGQGLVLDEAAEGLRLARGALPAAVGVHLQVAAAGLRAGGAAIAAAATHRAGDGGLERGPRADARGGEGRGLVSQPSAEMRQARAVEFATERASLELRHRLAGTGEVHRERARAHAAEDLPVHLEREACDANARGSKCAPHPDPQRLVPRRRIDSSRAGRTARPHFRGSRDDGFRFAATR